MDDLNADIAAISAIEAIPTMLDVICRTTGMGFAAVGRVTEERWIACEVKDEIDFGLKSGGELDIKTTICNEIRQSRNLVVIDHVAEDKVYCEHPTPALYRFQSYISVPIVLKDGSFFGTLCAIDPRPASLNRPEIIGMFKLFAELISFHLDAADRLNSSELRLKEERATSELREQFIAVLGHDLRNPLASIEASATMLTRTPLNDKGKRLVDLIHSSAGRMAGLIDNVLDFARGRLGGGLTLERGAAAPLEPILDQVVSELRASFPDRVLEQNFVLTEPVDCDRQRIGQLFSNLLGNALTHGAAEKPIRASAATSDKTFTLIVSNAGDPIPASALERLFQPFSRGAMGPSRQGLGLGLYIASEIARAHHGRIDVTSTPEETRFTFRMPLKGAELPRYAILDL